MQTPLLPLTVTAAVLGAALLGYSIVRTIGTVRSAVVARLLAQAEQDVDFAAPGRYVLHTEQPRLAATWAHASFTLHDRASGQPVRSWPIVFRTTTSGLSTVRLAVRGFEVEHAGRYRLSVTGLKAGQDTSRCALVVTRPYAGTLVAWIAGILLGAAGLLGGTVLSILRIVGKL